MSLVAAELTERIIGAAIEVHRALGPGLLESVYEDCFCAELSWMGLRFVRQVEVPLVYKGRRLERALRIDVLVEDTVVVELKSIERLLRIHEAQLLTYLRLTQKEVGLMINFNVRFLREGVLRRVMTHQQNEPSA